MRVDVYTICRNEAKMMPYFLRHYENIADRIFVWDDNSTDGTINLLQAHPKVTILPLDREGVNDEYWVREVWPQYKIHSRGKVNWVIQVDVDELLYHSVNARYQLRKMKDLGFDVIKPTGFLMCAEKFPTTSGQIYDEIKKGLRDRNMDKQCIFNPSVDISFRDGRHGLVHLSHPSGREVRISYFDSDLKLLHFRYFGMEDFLDRVKRNMERQKVGRAYGFKRYWPYRPEKVHRMPDMTNATYEEWYPKHIPEAYNVI